MSCIIKTAGPPVITVERHVAHATLPHVDEYDCLKCGGTLHTHHHDDEGYRFVTPCDGEKLRKQVECFNRALIPAKYAHDGFSTYKPQTGRQGQTMAELKSQAKAMQPGDPGAILTGAYGTGKTHLLCSILRFVTLERGIPGRFIELSHLIGDIKGAFNDREQSGNVLEELGRVPVLVIDELGKGRQTPFVQEQVEELVSRRYNAHGTTTFFSTNVPREQLADVIGQRAESRIAEMCRAVVLDGEDYRKR